MMRIAKIADDDGGTAEGGSDDAGGSLEGPGATGGVETGRAGGGLDAGRGGDATGRGGLDEDFSAFSGLRGSERRASLEPGTAGSEGERVVVGASVSSPSDVTIPGFERRRGMG
ncbi:MAG TPA: hypothetical protein VNW92_19460, partial [Polyangiaceae bacterium]|nr:hypothetical protein [Polyangiaceae bacterium]